MNKRFAMLMSAVLIAALACCFALAGCKKNADTTTGDQVTVTIAYSVGEGADYKSKTTTVAVAADATVYDAMEVTGWTIDAEDSAYGKWVHGIDGIQDSANTGWVYTENGNEVMDGASSHVVVDGATYDWTLISW